MIKKQQQKPPILLSIEEKAVIFGTLLGDAHIQKRGNSYRLKIEHCVAQKNLVLWKYSKLKQLCLTTQPPKVAGSQKYPTMLFYTSSGNSLKPIHEIFYKIQPDGTYRKVITKELIAQLPTPSDRLASSILLAVFYMDDGSIRDDCFAGKIASQGFTLDENHLLRDYLLTFNINANVVKHSTESGLYYLNLTANTFKTLVDLIAPVVKQIPDMTYKIKKNITP